MASAKSGQSPEEGGTLGEAVTLGKAALEATAIHPRVVVAGGSLMVVAGGSPMVAEAGGNPMVVVAGGNLMVAAGVKEVAATVNGASPISQKPT